jgi:hypothetical protein
MLRSVTVRNAVSNAVSNGTPTQPFPTRPDPTYRKTPSAPSSFIVTYVTRGLGVDA